MDIVADSLSAGLITSKNITVNNMDLREFLEEKMSTIIQFKGVFDDLSSAPTGEGFLIFTRDGNEYIYHEDEWEELGNSASFGYPMVRKEQSGGIVTLQDYAVNEVVPGNYSSSETWTWSDGVERGDPVWNDFGDYEYWSVPGD